jgi:parallel beta-helix repeat protein
LASVAAQTSSVHNLDTGLNYTTIQAAINAPETLNGHTIHVDAGTYIENVVVNKSISLIGENNSNTIVDGGGVGTVFTLTANNVKLTNFTIKNSSISGSCFGLLLDSCNNTIIQNNKITQNYMGLAVSQSSNNLFRNNTLFENIYNIAFSGSDTIEHHLQDVDTSNTVGGAPIYYWINHKNEQVPSDAGFVALVNCTNISVKNLTLKNNFNGLLIAYSSNTTIQNNDIKNNEAGIYLCYDSFYNQIIENTVKDNHIGVMGYGQFFYRPSNNWFFRNTITDNDLGLYFWRSHNNTICGNDITTNNDRGIYFWETYDNLIYENNIRDNEKGIAFSNSVIDNKFYHNNIVNNTIQVSASTGNNVWDDGFPSGGNYWSDYNGTDADGDSIGDTSYVIDENNQDNYPLMKPFGTKEHVLNVTVGDVNVPVVIVTNSSISEFVFSKTSQQVSFNVTGPTGTSGVCNISIPEDLLWGDFSVYLNGALLVEDADYTQTYNGTHNIFYITYSHSSHKIEITGTEVIPELSSLVFLSTFVMTTVVFIIYGKKPPRKR